MGYTEKEALPTALREGARGLSSVLLADILAGHHECPDCLGVIPLAANIITCRACSNSGIRHGTTEAERDLLTKVIGKLPEEFEQTRLELLRTMTDMSVNQADMPASSAWRRPGASS
jgi:hypothetical protein